MQSANQQPQPVLAKFASVTTFSTKKLFAAKNPKTGKFKAKGSDYKSINMAKPVFFALRRKTNFILKMEKLIKG